MNLPFEHNAKIQRPENMDRSVIKLVVMNSLLSVGIAVILGWVVPIFRKMYEDFGSALPGPTQLILDINRARWVSIPIWLLISLGGMFAAWRYSQRPRFLLRCLGMAMLALVVLILVGLYLPVFRL